MKEKLIKPHFLEIEQERYSKWLNNRAKSHVRRDALKFPTKKISTELYKIKIHEAVKNSNGIDYYTGEELAWDKISTYNNLQSKKEKDNYFKKFHNMPTVDHEYINEEEFDLRICSFRTNDCKNRLSYNELLSFCEKILQNKKNVISRIITIIIMLLIPRLAFSQAGSLDLTFGGTGIVTKALDSNAYCRAIAIQNDGKIVTVGERTISNFNSDFVLMRYNSNGALDNTFGTNGVSLTNFSARVFAYAVAIQSDGKILVAGSNTCFAIARYNTDGSIDNTFGNNGIASTFIVGVKASTAYSITIQSDGKIIAAGTTANTSNKDFAIVRYNSDGKLDNSFGSGGIVSTQIGTGDDIVYSVKTQSDGKIIAAGYATNTNKDFAVVRYNTDGTLDNTFGANGIVVNSIGTINDGVNSIALQSDGKILASGYSYTNSTSANDFTLVRYNSNGTLDNSFGTNGIVITDFGNSENKSDYSYSMAIMSDGQIIAAGCSGYDYAIAKYNSNGTLDNNFGTNGKVIQSVSDKNDEVHSIAIQTDSKIVIGGFANAFGGVGNYSYFFLGRYIGCTIANSSGVIIGQSVVCQGQSSVTYTVPAIINATSYVWSLPTGAIGTSLINSITVDYGLNATSGNITVKGTNSCGDGASSSLAITVNSLPLSAGPITGTTTVCQGQSSTTYTVPTITNATSYVWILPTGVTGASTTNSITVNYGNSAVSGNITVRGSNSCGDGPISSLAITVNQLASAPSVTSPVAYCQGVSASPLNATGSSLLWYSTSNGGAGSSTAPTPSTSIAGIVNYYVSQTTNNCESPRAQIAITTNAIPSAPNVTNSFTYCQGITANQLTANGSNLLWYNSSIGGTGSITAPTPNTTNAGSISYYVSQTANACESPRAQIDILINVAPSAPSATTSYTYCQGVSATQLSASGNDLLWYTASTGGSGSSVAPTPSTSSAGSINYYVSQTTNNCESPRTSIGVTTNTQPSAPIVTSVVLYCQNAQATALTANGSNLLWYALPCGGSSNNTAPTPTTSNVGTVNYYVSQTTGNCESPRAQIAVTVNAIPATPVVSQVGADLMSSIINGNQWYNLSGLIQGATQFVYSPTSNGYYYTIVSQNGCNSANSNILHYVATGIDNANSLTGLHIYPNPMFNELNIELKENTSTTQIELLNMAGEVVYKGAMMDKITIPTTTLSSGIYVLRFVNNKGVEYRKIVK